MMIYVTPCIEIDETEIDQTFIRASGPGGQNVNKVSTAVQLRFDAQNSPALPADVKKRLTALAGRSMTDKGILIINARRFRTQQRNRQDAMDRLIRLIRQAADKPRPRRRTRPTLAAKQRRLDFKRHRSVTKRSRRSVSISSD